MHTALDRKALQRVIKAAKNTTATDLRSINNIGKSETFAQSPKDAERRQWPNKLQKYPLPYHWTTEMLLSPDCETPELIINTPFPKLDLAGILVI